MEEETTKKRSPQHEIVEHSNNNNKKKAKTQNEEDDVITINEETANELISLLQDSTTPMKTTSYVTLKGNNGETCGSSFSVSESSVMAGFNVAGPTAVDLEKILEVDDDGDVNGGDDDVVSWFFGDDVLSCLDNTTTSNTSS